MTHKDSAIHTYYIKAIAKTNHLFKLKAFPKCQFCVKLLLQVYRLFVAKPNIFVTVSNINSEHANSTEIVIVDGLRMVSKQKS